MRLIALEADAFLLEAGWGAWGAWGAVVSFAVMWRLVKVGRRWSMMRFIEFGRRGRHMTFLRTVR
jgi:hypothetical protein